MDELIFHLKKGMEKKVTELEIDKYVMDNKLKVTAKTYIDPSLLNVSDPELIEHAQELMCHAMSKKVLPRVQWEAIPPTDIESTMHLGSIIVMTKEELVKLLGEFGVNIQK